MDDLIMWDGTLVLQRKRKGWSLLEDTILTTGSPSVFVCSSVLLNSLWSVIVHVCFAFTIVWSLSINWWLLITFWFGLLCFFITRPWQYRKGLSIQSTCTWMLPKIVFYVDHSLFVPLSSFVWSLHCLSVLRITASDYLYGTVKLFWSVIAPFNYGLPMWILSLF